MGVTLCRCFTDSCTNGCMPEGFALIKMTAPTGCPPTTLYDTSTGKSYPWNATFKADIGEDGCWTSCELPYSDHMHPEITYEIVDVIAGACSDDCGCDLQADCGCLGDTNSLPKCTISLLSTAGHTEGACVDVAALCAGIDPSCDNPQTVSVIFSDYCLIDGGAGGLGTWFAPEDGKLTIQFVSIPFGTTPGTESIVFDIIDTSDSTVLYTGTLPAGATGVRLDQEISITASMGIALRVVAPTFDDPPPSINIQGEYTYCPEGAK